MKREFIQEDYLCIEDLLRKYRDGDSESLVILLEKLEPLIISKCRHYFGTINEDLFQSGRLCCIESIQKFDLSFENVKFLGYQKIKLDYYFRDLKRSQIKHDSHECLLNSEGNNLIEGSTYEEEGYSIVELESVLDILGDKERYIVEHNIMQGETLKETSINLGISYDYSKELKKRAIQKLREFSENKNEENGC